jgi:gliding motility-associatede transport system auxiliary component
VALMQRLQSYSTLIGAFGIALVAGAFLMAFLTNTRRDVLLFLAGLGVVLVGFYIVTRPRDPARQTSTARMATQGVNVFVVALAFIGIVAAINLIVDKQFSRRLDLTANQEHTLSAQTIQVLQSLQQTVQVTGFFTPRTQAQRQDAQKLLDNYAHSTDKLVVQYVDPDENPALAQKYDNAQPGTVVFETTNAGRSRTEKVYTSDENQYTNAILKVTQTQQPAIYFTTGHGEYSPTDMETTGMGAITDFLKQTNYKVEPLNMATISNTLPADTSALIIAGPTSSFSPQDEKRVKDYLDQGGRVLFMSNPIGGAVLTDTLKAWGLTLENNVVLDPGLSYRGNPSVPVFQKFPSSPVTQDLETLGVFLPGVRSIQKDQNSDKQATALLTTTDQACAKTDFEKLKEQQQAICDEGDAKGPFVVGYAVEGAGSGGANPDHRSRLIVLGNALFATNRWMNNQDALGNQQLVANMINWLAGQEQLIAIPPRDPNLRVLSTFTGSDVNLVQLTSAGLIPLAALIIAALLWWRKR